MPEGTPQRRSHVAKRSRRGRLTTIAVDGDRITVEHLEAIDQTPVLDIKPVLEPLDRR